LQVISFFSHLADFGIPLNNFFSGRRRCQENAPKGRRRRRAASAAKLVVDAHRVVVQPRPEVSVIKLIFFVTDGEMK